MINNVVDLFNYTDVVCVAMFIYYNTLSLHSCKVLTCVYHVYTVKDKLCYANRCKLIGQFSLIMSSYEMHIFSKQIFDLEQE